MISFMAAFDPGESDALFASFGTGSLPFSFSSGQSTGQPAEYSFSGTADGATTALSFVNNTGESYIDNLDVEAAPAPTVGRRRPLRDPGLRPGALRAEKTPSGPSLVL